MTQKKKPAPAKKSPAKTEPKKPTPNGSNAPDGDEDTRQAWERGEGVPTGVNESDPLEQEDKDE